MNNRTSTADSYSNREKEALGKFSNKGLLRYRDLDAGYCTACNAVYGVECPKCHAKSGNHLWVDSSMFSVSRPLITDSFNNLTWTTTECSKCSYSFRILVQPVSIGE